MKTLFFVVGLFVFPGVPGLLFVACLSRRGPRTRNDVRGARQKPAFPRSARRLVTVSSSPSSEAAPAVLDGSQNGLQAADGPLPWPRTRDDVRGATQPKLKKKWAISRANMNLK